MTFPPTAPEDTLANGAGTTPLERARHAETLEAVFSAWGELRQAHSASRLGHGHERARLVREGQFLLGAVKAATGTTLQEPGLARTDAALQDFSEEAERRLRAAQADADLRAAADEEAFCAALAEVENRVEHLVQRYAERARPRLTLWMRPVGHDRALLHMERPGADASHVLLYLATGKIASRYEFLSDDVSDTVGLRPASLYPDAGLSPEAVRPDEGQLQELFASFGRVAPVKAFLPVPLPLQGKNPVFSGVC